MKRYTTLLLLFLLLVIAGCKKDNESLPGSDQLYQHIGVGRLYTTLIVKPLNDTEQRSAAFQTIFWNVRENLRINYGGRQLESFEIVFASATTITLRVIYRSDTGIATATYSYEFAWGTDGLLTLSNLTATNANGTNLQSYITELTDSYLGTHQFKAGWIEDKLPGSKGSLAVFSRSDDPSDYFYGTIK